MARSKIYSISRDPKTQVMTKRVLKPSEIKATIMQGYGLKDTHEYEKFYDITRNRLRVYQALHGGVPESPQQFLYTTAKSRIRYGEAYQPSERTKRIFATPSISTGRIKQYAERDDVRKAELDKIKADFQGFIDSLPPSYKGQATRLYNRILKDKSIPVKNYQMFLDYLAKAYHAQRSENGEVIPAGTLSGSGAKYERFDPGKYGTISIKNYLA